MLAKEIKIQNVKKQRTFIEHQLTENSVVNKDGDISYSYVGYLFPEVRKFFENKGFVITDFISNEIAVHTQGRTIHVFTLSDELTLSDEDWEEAEEAQFKYKTFDETIKEQLKEFFENNASPGCHIFPAGEFPFSFSTADEGKPKIFDITSMFKQSEEDENEPTAETELYNEEEPTAEDK